MLDWLKDILGDGYSKELDDKIGKEIGKGFIARADFNARSEELKKAKETITDSRTRPPCLSATLSAFSN